MNGTHLTLGLVGALAAAGALGRRRGSRDDEDDYEDEGHVGGHWGSAASGVVVTDGKRVLLLLRSPWVHTPGVWGYAGGALPVHRDTGVPRDPLTSALAEAQEEMGGLPSGRVVQRIEKREPSGFVYTTFVWRTTPSALDAFRPVLNWEHDDHKLFPLARLPARKTHPGALWALRRLERA